MQQLSHKLNNFTESVIRSMTRMANKYDAINISQGFPDFDPPKEILDAAKIAIDNGHNQYAITWGAQNFRQALAAKQSKNMKIPIDPEKNIVVTCGSTEAMMTAMILTSANG